MSHWPIELRSGEIRMRPLRYRDRNAWLEIRRENREWLNPWEATSPLIEEQKAPPTFFEVVRYQRTEGRAGRLYSFAIWQEKELIGQITLGGISYGAFRGAHVGYWIDKSHGNKGIMTKAVIEVTRFAFETLRLHRIEIALRPENGASKRVAEKAGYLFEGLRPRFLHIDGDWRDHIVFVKENTKV